MTKVALALIVKATSDEAPHLERCLKNMSKHVDGIFLNINHKEGVEPDADIMRIAKEYTDNIIVTFWNNNFAEARNENFAQVPSAYEWILWLDSDDTIDKPAKVKKIAEASPHQDSIFVDYLYDKDEQGNPLTVHMVARMVRNNGSHKWKGMIHETLVEQRSAIQGMTRDFTVVHHADGNRSQASYERNVDLLEKQLDAEIGSPDGPDPRTMYYLASTYMDSGQLESAKQLFNDYLELSGWDQERAVAETKLGRIYMLENNRAEAKKHFLLAIGEDPDNPEPRVEMGSLELELKAYSKAQSWLEYVLKMDANQTTLERNPMTATFRTYLLLVDVYMGMGGKWLEKAAKYAAKARKYKSEDPDVVKYTTMVEQIYQDKQELEKIITKYRKLKTSGKKAKAQALLDSIPEHLADNPVVATLRNAEKSHKWPEKTIAIMTGDTALDEWGPWSLKEGIGGSEEAIIRIAPKLQKLGYKVVVFAKPGSRIGLDPETGVMWQNYWNCNLDDEFDIFVAWRAPFIFERKIKARKAYLWLHDVMEPGEFTEKRIANFHKCILLSDYHRSLFPMIPDEKVLMSGNGIDPEEFVRYDDKFVRNPHRILYASSHVRGLAYIYKIWPEVKKAVPDAEIHIFYGRESYDAVHKNNPERMKWMDDMQQKAKDLDGVTDHGKVSQDRIMQEGFMSGLWAYPCPFPEIYCITAIKSQASGAVPVASNYAALDETIQYGHKQSLGEFDDADLEKYKEALIWWLQHPEEQEKVRPEMEKWARTKSWQHTAEGWDEDFSA